MTNPSSDNRTQATPPDWSQRRFIVLDPTNRWAPAIGLQLQQEHADVQAGVFFETCQTAREVLLLAESRNSIGLIMFLEGLEKESLGLLRRLSVTPNPPTILVVAASRHAELMPVMLEAGASAFLQNVENDIPIAAWCSRVLASIRQ